MKKNFYICLTFDTDPDPNIKSLQLDSKTKNIYGWLGLDRGANLILNKIKKLKNKLKLSLPMTWFIRVDDQIEFYHGCSTWILKKYIKLWKKITEDGGSLQWHIHLNVKTKGKWLREKRNKKINRMISKNYDMFSKAYKKPDCIRIGEAYMSQNLAKKIRSLGIKSDSSAIPGRARYDDEKYFNWLNISNQPYYISSKSYKKKASKKEKKTFLEIPMNTINTKCSYDKKKIKRYINLSFYNKILIGDLNNFIKKNNYMITITHPFEILRRFKKKENSKLISFSLNEFEKNITSIVNLCKKNNKKPVFVNINKIIDQYV